VEEAAYKEGCIDWNQYYTKCTTGPPSSGVLVLQLQSPGPTNPYHGAISFDNIGLAWVAIFLVISLEGWTDVMYYVQDAHSFWNWIYFVMLIVVSRRTIGGMSYSCRIIFVIFPRLAHSS
jgi:hypothetical protein